MSKCTSCTKCTVSYCAILQSCILGLDIHGERVYLELASKKRAKHDRPTGQKGQNKMEKIVWKPGVRFPDGSWYRFDSYGERSAYVDTLLDQGYTYCKDFWTCEIAVPESELYGW